MDSSTPFPSPFTGPMPSGFQFPQPTTLSLPQGSIAPVGAATGGPSPASSQSSMEVDRDSSADTTAVPSSSTPATRQLPTAVIPPTVQQPDSDDDSDLNRADSNSHLSTSFSSEDNEMKNVRISDRYGTVRKYKINWEALEAIKTVGDAADRLRDFKVVDLDLREFGLETREIDQNSDAQTVLFDSCRDLDSDTLASTSSAYSSFRSLPSHTQSEPTAGTSKTEDTYHRIKQRLDVMRDEKDLSQLLSLQKELEDEIEKFKSDVNLRRRNEGGFHEDGTGSEACLISRTSYLVKRNTTGFIPTIYSGTGMSRSPLPQKETYVQVKV